ncbi:hypothetical protein GWI33_002435 [Rhynchophorus ferrugineus]|uniref:Uncharacterized protein n=1 Tax=Rhynchophorus ferrugineus TaxID=354439 RepID=A0A834MK88_RHYFE|nr:hypothetical protein GWI33_002435 [Rhynchophorus ferrugineus]
MVSTRQLCGSELDSIEGNVVGLRTFFYFINGERTEWSEGNNRWITSKYLIHLVGQRAREVTFETERPQLTADEVLLQFNKDVTPWARGPPEKRHFSPKFGPQNPNLEDRS